MSRYQSVRGNPETKLMVINQEFSGGVNIIFSDDLVNDNEMRYLSNFDLDNTGELRARKGFSKNNALTQLFNQYDTVVQFPIFAREVVNNYTSDVALMRLLQNDHNAWKVLSSYSTLEAYQADYGSENNVIKMLIVAKQVDNTTAYWIKKYTIGLTTVTTDHKNGTLPFTLSIDDNLVNIRTGEQFGKLFFTDNNKGLVEFNNLTDTFTYYWTDLVAPFTNSAYKPNGIEVRRVGFNMLGDSPLSWISNSGVSVPTIQGVYVTVDSDGKTYPVTSIPSGMKFRINVIYTGSSNYEFTFSFAEFESTIEATVTLVSTSGGLAKYDVVLATQPTSELQMNINFAVDQGYEDYIDYYTVGPLDANAKEVTTLNAGEYGICQIYDRLVFYKGNELWFSDINNFSYIPNFNFILLPIENTDKIVRIVYFRTSYIIFTTKKIFKLVGEFGSTSLTLDLVNDDIGCVAPNTVCLVENELFFLSTRGLRALKTDTFREGLENIKEFDEKIYPMITNNEKAYGILYKDQYLLYSNLRDLERKVSVRGRIYDIPDVVKYYYRTGSFAFDNFEPNNYPRFIFIESGDLYSILDLNFYQFGKGYDDFGMYFDLVFETPGVSLGYPLHEKKFKHVVFKFGIDSDINNIYVETFGDGIKSNDAQITPLEEGTTVDIESSRFMLGKERLPSKCRNIGVRVTIVDAIAVSVQSLAYIFKLGKIREH